MAREKSEMRRVKEVLRLRLAFGLSHKAISAACRMRRTTVRDYCQRAKAAGIDSFAAVEPLSERALEARLFTTGVDPNAPDEDVTRLPAGRPTPDWAVVHRELNKPGVMYLPARRSSTLPHSTGPSPSGRSFGSDRRHCSSGSDPGPFALTPFLSTSPRSDSWHRFGRTFACAYIRPYHRGLQAGLCVPCFSPFRLRVSHDSGHTFPMDDTRPPWVTDALPHRVARTHLGATGWNPCAFAPIVRARPFPVFGRPVHRSGLLPLITTRWFSTSLSDPASRRAPCPPEHRRWWAQVGLSVSRLSPSCLTCSATIWMSGRVASRRNAPELIVRCLTPMFPTLTLAQRRVPAPDRA